MPRWTEQDLLNYERKHSTRTKLPAAKLEHNVEAALVKAPEGKAESISRIGLRIVVYRCVLLDTDNSYGATKQLADCLCTVGLLPGDNPTQIDLQVEQVKVAHRHEQKTVVEIHYP